MHFCENDLADLETNASDAFSLAPTASAIALAEAGQFTNT